jgi:hypothetical protein
MCDHREVRGPDRLARLRVAGLAATAVLAAGAYGAGALPGADPAAGLRAVGPLTASWPYWLGLAGWLAGLVALAVTWWRLGRAVPHPEPRVSPRWLLVTGALWAAPLLLAPPVGSRDVYAYACQGALWLDGANPYAVGVAAGGCPWVAAVPPLWQDTPTPYGPLAIALSGGVVAIARALTASTGGQLLVAISLFRAVALGGALLLARYVPRLARACGVDPAAATWLGLLSPLVAVHVVSGAHNDALLAGLVVAALALALAAPGQRALALAAPGERALALAAPAQRALALAAPGERRARLAVAVAAGAVLGLATAVKVTAVVAVPFVVLLATIPSSRDRAARLAGDSPDVRPDLWERGRAGVAVLGGGVLAFAGLTVATGLDLGWIGALRDTGRLAQWTSLPTGLGMAAGYALRLAGRPEAYATAVAVARVLGLAALVAAFAALVVRGWRAAAGPPATAPRVVVTACGSAFAALAVLSPVFYPWYAVTALAVLAAGVADPRWRRRLAGLALALSFLVLPGGLGLAVLTKLPGALLDVVLVVALIVAARRASTRRSRDGRHDTPEPLPPIP